MNKEKILAALAAAVFLTASGCSDSPGKLVPADSSSSQAGSVTAELPADSTADTTASAADTASETVTQSETVTSQTTTSAAASTTKETAKKTTPRSKTTVEVDNTPIFNSAAWFSKVNKVTSNEDLKTWVGKLDNVIKSYGSRLGFAYYDVINGVTISYNANTKFQTCSTIKVPYCKALLESGISPDELVTIRKAYAYAAPEPGHLTADDINKKYTVKSLIENTVRLSDNTAYINLIDTYGRYVFNSMQYRLGINCLMYDGYYFGMATANEMLASFIDVYEYSNQSELGKWLVKLMCETSSNYQISAALGERYKVAHKYGADHETSSYHDCAICYAERPFILCIMTEQTPETDEANQSFQEMAEIFAELNEIIVS
ncbi:MAG: serine hydrolase [Ruminococcus sp.]|nr:serine hydrolase [Ruminococcus sp.]